MLLRTHAATVTLPRERSAVSELWPTARHAPALRLHFGHVDLGRGQRTALALLERDMAAAELGLRQFAPALPKHLVRMIVLLANSDRIAVSVLLPLRAAASAGKLSVLRYDATIRKRMALGSCSCALPASPHCRSSK